MQQWMRSPHILLVAAVGAVLVAAGVPLGSLLFLGVLLACPLMMVLMMRGMGGGHGREDHTGHGCEHDPARTTGPRTGQDR